MDNAAIKSGLEVFTTAIGAAKALIGLAGSSKNTEFKEQAGEVLQKLGDAREKYLDLQEKYVAALDENRRLKARLAEQNAVNFHDGAYWRKHDGGEEGPFCPACWERDSKLVRGQINCVEGGEVQYFCGHHQQNYLYNVPEKLVKDTPLDSHRPSLGPDREPSYDEL